MTIMSPAFFLLLAVSLFLYYILPHKYRWMVLLAGSLVFVASYDARYLLFLMASAWSIWAAGRKFAALAGRDPACRKKKKRLLLLALFFNLGILVLLKYVLPPLSRSLLHAEAALVYFIPIGISYYTLMAVSYLMDTYWERIPAEKSYPRVLLYLSYFPQILQGPISRYQDLSRELFEQEHPFEGRNLKHGVQRILWGMVKITVFADFLAAEMPKVSTEMYGLAMFLGFALFGIQLYCNFSGGIDLVCGVSECFGICLPENFNQPFFSRSLGEFWRRWHITLGSWMKDYVFYPVSMSRPASRLKKSLKKHLSRKTANRIVMAAADVLVFVLVGVWHGTGMNYLIWGLYNGLILAFSELMTEHYARAKEKLGITGETRWWPGFCLVRTFIITTIGWSTDCASTAGETWALVANMLQLQKTSFAMYNVGAFKLAVLALVLVTLLVVGILREKGHSVRQLLDGKPFFFQVLFWVAVIQVIACLGKFGASGGLMYAIF